MSENTDQTHTNMGPSKSFTLVLIVECLEK